MHDKTEGEPMAKEKKERVLSVHRHQYAKE